MKKHLVLLLTIILLTSCATLKVDHSNVLPFLGKKGNIVVYSPFSNIKPILEKNMQSSLISYLEGKTTSFFAVFDKSGKSTYISNGSYSMASLNLGLEHLTNFKVKKAKNNYLTYYSDNKLNIGVPNNYNILITEDDYKNVYNDYISYKRKENINKEDEKQLLNSYISIYSLEPEKIPFTIENFPENLLNEIHLLLLSISKENNLFYLNGRIELKNDKYIKTLTSFIKSTYIKTLKEKNIKINYSKLKDDIIIENNIIYLNKVLIDLNKYLF